MELRDMLILGAYVLNTAAFALLWKAVLATKACLGELRIEIARRNGIMDGQEHERRVTRLERAHATCPEFVKSQRGAD